MDSHQMCKKLRRQVGYSLTRFNPIFVQVLNDKYEEINVR